VLWRQATLIVGLLVLAVVVQVTLLSRLGLPQATPDLVVVTVVALGLALGPTRGAIAGFVGGMLVDLAPPADTPLGINALVYLVIGYVTGFIIDPRDRTVPLLMGIVGLAVGGATLAVATIEALLGSDRVAWDRLPLLVLTSALYGVALAPLVVPGVTWLARRITPEVLVE
jgi:rod shape-determining protein MreD